MNAALLSVIALGLISMGVTVTYLLATRLPMALLTTAQEHGRFAGLGSSQEIDGVGRATPKVSPARQPQFAHA
ncbi:MULTISPECIES: hypothetical protein [unclassified Cupriavidus]|uniref:hypothetical protein n=1 Tax=unclassified Cupriavidus TaxID=2640874 RepID=UPI00088ABD28|nr:hypothetical protein [Cupriavidus sp. YR651]SDD44563.1 hypothetical protein SAMN05216345_10966 [Cupriavidus sp. YR651]